MPHVAAVRDRAKTRTPAPVGGAPLRRVRLKGDPGDVPSPQPKARRIHPLDWACEFVGTAFQLFLGFCIVAMLESDRSPVKSAISPNALRLILIGVAFGALAALVALSPLGRRSGAHLNPSVTIGFVLRGHTPLQDAIGYTAAQTAGATVAAALFVAALPGWSKSVGSARTEPAPSIPSWGVVGIEAALTLGLLLTVFLMVSSSRTARWTPAVVTAVLAGLIWAGAPRTGASMNPARTLGPDLVSSRFPTIWAYIVGPSIGAALAVVAFKLLARERETLTAKLFHDEDYPSLHATALPAKPHRASGQHGEQTLRRSSGRDGQGSGKMAAGRVARHGTRPGSARIDLEHADKRSPPPE